MNQPGFAGWSSDLGKEHKLIVPPPPAGYWRIGECKYPSIKRPNWLHRKMTTFLLGWVWVAGDGK